MLTSGHNFWWFPHFGEVGFRTALSSFHSIWMTFSFQFNFFPIAIFLEAPTEHRIMKMSKLGLLFSLIFYTLVGFFGYAVYTIDTKPNILESFLPD